MLAPSPWVTPFTTVLSGSVCCERRRRLSALPFHARTSTGPAAALHLRQCEQAAEVGGQGAAAYPGLGIEGLDGRHLAHT